MDFNLKVGKQYKGVATFRNAANDPGKIYGDPTIEVTDPSVVEIVMQPPPADNAFPNNPVHVIVTCLTEGAVTAACIAPDADPAEGMQSLRLEANIIVGPADAPPSVGGEFVLDPNPIN